VHMLYKAGHCAESGPGARKQAAWSQGPELVGKWEIRLGRLRIVCFRVQQTGGF